MSEAFYKACQLLIALGFKDIAGKLITQAVDGDWIFTINASNKVQDDKLPMTIYVEYRGFPVGVIGATGGAMMAESEGDFIKALDVAIKAQQGGEKV